MLSVINFQGRNIVKCSLIVVFWFILTGCATIDSIDVKNNARHKDQVQTDLNIEQANELTKAILLECYPKIGMSLFVTNSVDKNTGITRFTLGNDLYGGLLLIELSNQQNNTLVDLYAVKNAWTDRFPYLVKSFNTSSIKPCTEFWKNL
jgi:hypothetical protein